MLFSTLLPNGFAGADLAYGPSGRAHLLGPAGYLSQIDTTAPALPPLLGVANAAAANVTGRIVAGELVSLFGASIGPDSPQGLRLHPDGKVATELGGVDVRFNGRPADRSVSVLKTVRRGPRRRVEIPEDRRGRQRQRQTVEEVTTCCYASNLEVGSIPPLFLSQLARSRWQFMPKCFRPSPRTAISSTLRPTGPGPAGVDHDPPAGLHPDSVVFLPAAAQPSSS